MRQYDEQLKLREKYYLPPENKVQNFLTEPLLEGSTEAAKEIGMDQAEFRKKNFILEKNIIKVLKILRFVLNL